MEINPNVDDMLIESMTGTKLEPAPEKAPEVPRETNSPDFTDVSGSKVTTADELSDKPPVKAEEPVVTNEYGDKSQESQQSQGVQNEYGLEPEAPKMYTKAEMDAFANQVVRDRLARLERNHQPPQTQQQQQQAAQQGFQYDENSNQDWQQQLEQFTMQVIDKREQARERQLQQAIEQEQLQAFETKFKHGMSKFNDYHEVLAGKNVSDAMLMAASEINDPAALFYAAAKRMPDELAKIAEIKSPLAQAAAIGRLDEKLRKASVKVSSAPKPVSQTKADTTTVFHAKQSSGNPLDDLLLADKSNRLAQINARRR